MSLSCIKSLKYRFKQMLLNILICWYSKRLLPTSIISEISNKAKLIVLCKSLKTCGRLLSVQFPVTVVNPQMIEIGDNVSIAAYVHMWGKGGINIGNRVMIGSHTAIASLTHDYSKEIMFDTLIEKNVFIEDDVWIGTHCIILPGIRIGKGAVVGAGTLVTKNVPPNTIFSGIPGQIRKQRI